MAYGLVAADILARFSVDELEQLTDGDGAFDEAKVDQAIRDGAGEFDGYAARYYATPVTPVSEAIRTNLLDLVAWRLVFNTHAEWLNADSEKALTRTRRRSELLKWMQDLGAPDRKVVLAGCEERVTPGAAIGFPAARSAGRKVLPATLRRLV